MTDGIHEPMGGVVRPSRRQSEKPGLNLGNLKMINASNKEKRYDFIVVGGGAAGSVLAAGLSASGAQVLVVESEGSDDAPTIANPSIWFYNVGGPLDYHLAVNQSPLLNNRTFNMALGHVFGGGAESKPGPRTLTTAGSATMPALAFQITQEAKCSILIQTGFSGTGESRKRDVPTKFLRLFRSASAGPKSAVNQ